MSITALNHVFNREYKSASAKLMMIAIADRCDDEGVCYNGVKYLMKKHNKITRRTAERLLTSLEETGDLVIVLGKGIETAHGMTNRYYLKTLRDEMNLATPRVGTRADQLEDKTTWIRPEKQTDPTKTTGHETDDRPDKNDGSDPTPLTGQDPTKTTGNPFVYPPGESNTFAKANDAGGDALPDSIDEISEIETDDSEINPFEDSIINKRTGQFLGIYFSRLDSHHKKQNGGVALPISRGEWRAKNFNSFKPIAALKLVNVPGDPFISAGEFAEYLDYLLASDWYKRKQEMPAIDTVAKKIVLRVRKNRAIVKQQTAETENGNGAKWSDFE